MSYTAGLIGALGSECAAGKVESMESREERGAAGWPRYRWVVSPPPPPSYCEQLSHLHPLLIHVLHNRGVVADEADAFLRAAGSLSRSPFLLKGMNRAVERLREALDKHECIAVYGDFDVDGVTSTVLLVQVLRALDANVIPYIPHRTREGYGLNKGAVQSLHERGVSLIVTVDCGSSSVGGVRAAARLGIDVVITDHHIVPRVLPKAVAIVNPQQPGCPYPFKSLAGVGIAFKVAQALTEKLMEGRPREGRQQILREVLDLVAIGSIADMVPLVGENCLLVKTGLSQINNAMRVGIQTLVASSGLKRGTLSAFDVGYRLAPRLNAAGRIDDAAVGYSLLMTQSHEEADALVSRLEQQNTERQRRTQEVLDAARLQLAAAPAAQILVVGDRGWPGGVLGLVAGRLTDEFARPAFVFAQATAATRGRGSARGVAGFNVMDALGACHDLLAQYGGHAQAAGFSIKRDKLVAFRERLQQWAKESEMSLPEQGPQVLAVDAEVSLADLSLDVHDRLAELEPCGAGLATPIFLCRHLRLVDHRVVGNNHLRLTLGTSRRSVNAIAFGQGDLASKLTHEQQLDVVFSLEANEWNGSRSVQLKIRDLAPAFMGAQHAPSTPSRTLSVGSA